VDINALIYVILINNALKKIVKQKLKLFVNVEVDFRLFNASIIYIILVLSIKIILKLKYNVMKIVKICKDLGICLIIKNHIIHHN